MTSRTAISRPVKPPAAVAPLSPACSALSREISIFPPSPGSHAGREGKQFLIFKLPILRARPRFAKWRAYARMETQLPADLLSRTDCRLSGRNRESDRKRKRRGGRAVGGGWLRPAVRHRARKRGDLYC